MIFHNWRNTDLNNKRCLSFPPIKLTKAKIKRATIFSSEHIDKKKMLTY